MILGCVRSNKVPTEPLGVCLINVILVRFAKSVKSPALEIASKQGKPIVIYIKLSGIPDLS